MRFQVSTRRTGHLRVVKVDIFDEYADFLETYHRYGKQAGYVTEVPDGYQIDGACISRKDWDDRDPNPYQARILLAWPTITASIIAHEITHAALHLYSIDSYRDHSRAAAHVNISNEVIPYIVGDLFAAISHRILASGADLNVGVRGAPA